MPEHPEAPDESRVHGGWQVSRSLPAQRPRPRTAAVACRPRCCRPGSPTPPRLAATSPSSSPSPDRSPSRTRNARASTCSMPVPSWSGTPKSAYPCHSARARSRCLPRLRLDRAAVGPRRPARVTAWAPGSWPPPRPRSGAAAATGLRWALTPSRHPVSTPGAACSGEIVTKRCRLRYACAWEVAHAGNAGARVQRGFALQAGSSRPAFQVLPHLAAIAILARRPGREVGLRGPQPRTGDLPGRRNSPDRPAARRRRRSHRRPGRPDPARRRCAVRHHRQEHHRHSLTTEQGKEDRLEKRGKEHPLRPEAERG